MTHGKNKYQSRLDREVIRKVLLETWDPIGVASLPPGGEGQYDRYVGKIYAMMMEERATRDQIRDYLREVATRRMGLRITPGLLDSCERTADELVALRPQFEMH